MFTSIRNSNITLIVTLIAVIMLVSACKNSPNNSKEKVGEYDVLMHFLQEKTYYSDSSNLYMFICGPQCKGCTINMLYRLDSLYPHHEQIRNISFITSHKFVDELKLENIVFISDESWENANIDFFNMRFYGLSDTGITTKAVLTADNEDKFIGKLIK
jgi:hypothetical protein